MTRKCINRESRKEMTRFEDETFTIEHAGSRIKVEGLSGWRCGSERMEPNAQSHFLDDGLKAVPPRGLWYLWCLWSQRVPLRHTLCYTRSGEVLRLG
jgi:hypothetical protein